MTENITLMTTNSLQLFSGMVVLIFPIMEFFLHLVESGTKQQVTLLNLVSIRKADAVSAKGGSLRHLLICTSQFIKTQRLSRPKVSSGY